MIYYVRRLNSHTSVAETFNIPVYNSTAIGCGTVCSISDGRLTPYRSITKAGYLALEDKRSDDGKETVSCVRLAPEMVLKAMPNDSISDYRIGDNCSLASNSDEITLAVERTGTEAEVIGIDGNYVIFILK